MHGLKVYLYGGSIKGEGIVMNKEKAHEIVEYMVEQGRKLPEISGKVEDIGVKKEFLTEYDLKIERGLKSIVDKMQGKHFFFSEEENDKFEKHESVWIADPISSTQRFIYGQPNYAVVVSHMQNGRVDFGAVFVPTADDLYVATEDDGVFKNDNKIEERKELGRKIIYAPVYKESKWQEKIIKDLEEKLKQEFEVFGSQGSFAYNYCLVAEGKFDGVVSLTKDAFPEFAGCYIANKSGVIATNIKGEKDISHKDRVFICGHEGIYNDLFGMVKSMEGELQYE